MAPLSFARMPRMHRIALATAVAAEGLDEDMAPLIAALDQAGIRAEVRAWDDDGAAWAAYDAVVLRSTWDYAERRPAFLAWCQRVEIQSRLFNPFEVVRWNTDKRYLADLEALGVAVVPSRFLHWGDDPSGFPQFDEFVLKPTIGAGSRDARRFGAEQRDEAIAHAARLLAAGRSVLVQPYLDQVDDHGETALIFFEGVFSHAIRKGPLLARGAESTGALFAAEHIQRSEPSPDELELAHRALSAQPFGRLAYARIDLLPSDQGPRLLELELSEPSLFFDHAPGSAERFAAALAARISAAR